MSSQLRSTKPTREAESLQRQRNLRSLVVGVRIGAATLENPQKSEINQPRDQALWHMPKGLNILFHRHLLSHVHINNSQEAETTRMSDR